MNEPPHENTNDASLTVYGYLRADTVPEFRMGQLLIAICSESAPKHALDLDRLAVVEFLAANPFLLVSPDGDAALQLRLAGFGAHSLSYAAPGQRYATRRERLLQDLSRLVSTGLVTVDVVGGKRVILPTMLGLSQSDRLTSTYADAFRASLAVVLPVVRRLSDTALRHQLEVWLRADPTLFDLVDLVPTGVPTLEGFLITGGPLA